MGYISGEVINKIARERKIDDVCPGFKQRINDIVYGVEPEEEFVNDQRWKQSPKKEKETPSY